MKLVHDRVPRVLTSKCQEDMSKLVTLLKFRSLIMPGNKGKEQDNICHELIIIPRVNDLYLASSSIIFDAELLIASKLCID